MSDPAPTEAHDHLQEEDPNGKADLSGFQPGFLEEVQKALDAGFLPDDADPEFAVDMDDDAAVTAALAEAASQ